VLLLKFGPGSTSLPAAIVWQLFLSFLLSPVIVIDVATTILFTIDNFPSRVLCGSSSLILTYSLGKILTAMISPNLEEGKERDGHLLDRP
jgi:hypothetical protein